MGIYSSGLSCWQRHHMGLKQDHAGPTTIDEDEGKVAKPEVVEVKKTEEPKPKKKPANSLKSSLQNDD